MNLKSRLWCFHSAMIIRGDGGNMPIKTSLSEGGSICKHSVWISKRCLPWVNPNPWQSNLHAKNLPRKTNCLIGSFDKQGYHKRYPWQGKNQNISFKGYRKRYPCVSYALWADIVCGESGKLFWRRDVTSSILAPFVFKIKTLTRRNVKEDNYHVRKTPNDTIERMLRWPKT